MVAGLDVDGAGPFAQGPVGVELVFGQDGFQPKISSILAVWAGSLTLNSNTGPAGRSLRSSVPVMPQRAYMRWAKLATPSVSVCSTMPRSSKYLPKQATA